MDQPFQLHTRRLQLRRLRPEDASAISAYRSLPDVARYQGWETFDLDDAAKLIAEQLNVESGDTDSWLQLMIILSETGEPVGDCGIHFANAARQVELGITLNPRYQHRGFAHEALEGVLEYVFGTLNIHRASATTDAENKAAHNLFQRLGFRLEGQFADNVWFKGAWGGEYLFAMLQAEWHARTLCQGSARPDDERAVKEELGPRRLLDTNRVEIPMRAINPSSERSTKNRPI